MAKKNFPVLPGFTFWNDNPKGIILAWEHRGEGAAVYWYEEDAGRLNPLIIEDGEQMFANSSSLPAEVLQPGFNLDRIEEISKLLYAEYFSGTTH